MAHTSTLASGSMGRNTICADCSVDTHHASTKAGPKPCCTNEHAVTGECTSIAAAHSGPPPKNVVSARPSGVSRG
ncbi:hypothetical protein D3C80_2097470 [compost metagenome]